MTISRKWYASGLTETICNHSVFRIKDGRGPTLYCIHGFPSSSWDFEPMWAALKEKFQVIASDLIGLGKSAKPKNKIPISLQADVIESICEKEGILEAHLLAHDLGDTVAQELLARQMEGTSTVVWKSCIMMNGGIFPETHRPLLAQKLLISPLGPLIAHFMSEKTLRKSFKSIFSPDHQPSESYLTESWKLITYDGGKACIPYLIQYMKERSVHRERWVKPLSEKIIPIRLVNGILDPISGQHAADRFAEVVSDADIVFLPDAGHYPHVEQPNEVLKTIFDFHDALKT